MTFSRKSDKFGVHDMARGLHEGLQKYIEAQYHIRDDGLVQERKALLEMPSVIAQKAYIEATPVYLADRPYDQLAIPAIAQDILTRIAAVDSNVGLYPTPYRHQTEALEAFFGPESLDLIVATGTGSGKTESFLMPLVANLAIESTERSSCRDLHGCRAILLYPMNALVNDQVARIRRLLGNSKVNEIVSAGRNRPVLFGSYTGRTSYPGKRTSSKDNHNITPLFDEFYKPLLEEERNADLLKKLVEMGRWPSKDMKAFYNEEATTTRTVLKGKRAGKTDNVKNWKYRLVTQPGDRELMTRHEMQLKCPDVLVTNYSMLEYMLMRPIENNIFKQTSEWLGSDEKNELLLVIDEAHMYRGAGGAEVALLIRRLVARLGVTRDRVRCILTSASLGTSARAKEEILEFAQELTGITSSSNRAFTVVTGTLESRLGSKPASAEELSALADTNIDALADHLVSPEAAMVEVSKLATRLGWPVFPHLELRDYLYQVLTGFGPAEHLIEKIAGNATALSELSCQIFPTSDSEPKRQKALDALLILCSAAKRASDDRIYIPTRIHLFHRGLPGLFACIDPSCNKKLTGFGESSLLGRFHTKSTAECNCTGGSRVYEFNTHRDCGAPFLRGWVDAKVNFVWHEPEVLISQNQQRHLFPVDMLVGTEPHANIPSQQAWLHMKSGRLERTRPATSHGFTIIWIPDKDVQVTGEMTYDLCPVCRKRTRQTPTDPSKIMDHVTKGEAPFSTLVRSQMAHQPPTKPPTQQSPNSGRKVLIFSDGRQKAARLARDMPRDMELDLFRQVVAVAAMMLRKAGKEAQPTDNVLYTGFLAVLLKNDLAMFDVESWKVDNHIKKFHEDCDGDLEVAFDTQFLAGDTPSRYKTALLKLLCSNYYSLEGTTVGFIEPNKRALIKIQERLSTAGVVLAESDARAIAVCWIQTLLDQFAFDVDLKNFHREKASGFVRMDWSSNGKFEKNFRSALISRFGKVEKEIVSIESVMTTTLATSDNGIFLNPNSLKLTIELDRDWFQCGECTSLTPFSFQGRCTICGNNGLQVMSPKTNSYMRARKSFWREPVESALAPDAKLTNLYVEEHTAQLSNRDRKTVHSTTELHELRFQDVLLSPKDRPIDVLSCTTTMEVGIDIGSLVAVALRNVPPQRENYQQRAGRAGRRGSSVSSVLTYSQNGPHDSYYFANPKAIVSGPPRSPELKTDNAKIARRHVHSFLIQTYFREALELSGGGSTGTAILSKSLGETRSFFHGVVSSAPNLIGLRSWVNKHILGEPFDLRTVIANWLPANLDIAPLSLIDWVSEVTRTFIECLELMQQKVPKPIAQHIDDDEDDDGGSDAAPNFDQEDLLEFLFFHSLLPSYAFPNSLCSFLVQRRAKSAATDRWEIRTEQMPQQSANQALSEYAPGRLIVINKKTYRSGGVFASVPAGDRNKAERLFSEAKSLVMCETCSFLQDPFSTASVLSSCPVCGGSLIQELMIQPEVFGPEKARALDEEDREQEYTFATMAQFPQPTNGEMFAFINHGPNLRYAYAVDKRLLTLNKGGKGVDAGFDVCKKCGCAAVHDSQNPKQGKHIRPYLVSGTEECTGDFATTFLGFSFTSDLLLLRLTIASPLITDLSNQSVIRTLEIAANSIAEGLRLAASRHERLDLDATEFGAGYRLLSGVDDSTVELDIYLYDTLAGGAGYAELAAKYFGEIVSHTLELLEGCNCDRSCTECLDHFHNQNLKRLLDRRIAAALLRYGMYGTIPEVAGAERQRQQLAALMGWLELDGISCTGLEGEIGGKFGVTAEGRNGKVALGTFPALLSIDALSITPQNGMRGLPISEANLSRNLPGVHAAVRAALD